MSETKGAGAARRKFDIRTRQAFFAMYADELRVLDSELVLMADGLIVGVIRRETCEAIVEHDFVTRLAQS